MRPIYPPNTSASNSLDAKDSGRCLLIGECDMFEVRKRDLFRTIEDRE